MPRTCTICRHDQRQAIDEALVAGEPFRRIAAHFETSDAALRRHKEHLPGTLVKAHEAKEVAQADSLLDQVRQLADEAREILGNVKTSQPGTAVQAVKAVAQVLELQAKILGEIRAETQVNVALVQSPEWTSLRARLVQALVAYPEAQRAVIAALTDGDGHA